MSECKWPVLEIIIYHEQLVPKTNMGSCGGDLCCMLSVIQVTNDVPMEQHLSQTDAIFRTVFFLNVMIFRYPDKQLDQLLLNQQVAGRIWIRRDAVRKHVSHV